MQREKEMGVKDLMSIIRSKCPAVLKKGAPFAQINRVWVDTPLLIVASCKIAESEGHDPFLLIEQSLRKTSNQILALECKEVRWIFDGRGRPEKKRTIIGRSNNHVAYSKKCEKKAEQRLLLLDDLTLAESVYTSFLPVRRVTIRDITNYAMQLLKTFPLSTVETAKHDSEEHIARMMEAEDIALTNDSDAIVFGCSTIAQNFGSPNETWLELKDVLEGLGLTMHELRMLAVFLGNDFNARIPKRGAVTALKAVQDKKTIEQYADSEAWKAEAEAAYQVFCGKNK